MVAQVALEMMNYFDGDIKRINHALKVYSYAKTIGELEGLSRENQEILELAALLHDIGIKEAERKYGSASGKYQELEGPAVAKTLLDAFELEKAVLDRVCFLIGHHHSYACIDELDFQILVEADFLVNIHEDQMNVQQIKSVVQRYFKTNAGIAVIRSCYGEIA